MWLYPIFRFFESNPWARAVAAVGAGLATFWAFMTLRDRRIRKEAKEEGREEVIEEIEEQTNDRVERAREAAASTDDLNAEQLRQLRAKDPNNRSRVP